MPLKVHFLNVGRGDCTIIEFPLGRIGMVDIDNLRILDPDTRKELLLEYRESAEYALASHGTGLLGGILLDEDFIQREQQKLTDPLAYYDVHIGKNKDIFRLIITHPDMDHMTGLYRLHKQDQNKNIVNFWHTGHHDFNLEATTDADWEESPYDKRDWDTYKQLRSSKQDPKSLQNHQFDKGEFWTDDGIEIWAPTPELEKLAVDTEKSNVLSMVLKITYMGRSIVLGGDATADETWRDIYPKINMSGISVLKASHHGRKSGY